jgi:hypothetical protein
MKPEDYPHSMHTKKLKNMIKFLKALRFHKQAEPKITPVHYKHFDIPSQCVDWSNRELQLNDYIHDLNERTKQRETNAIAEEHRIKEMFIKHKHGLISDEEFKDFLLE